MTRNSPSLAPHSCFCAPAIPPHPPLTSAPTLTPSFRSPSSTSSRDPPLPSPLSPFRDRSGHDYGRPIFGARYVGGPSQDLLLTWGSDGRLCLWDSRSSGQVGAPLAVLVYDTGTPLYAVDATEVAAAVEEEVEKAGAVVEGGKGEGEAEEKDGGERRRQQRRRRRRVAATIATGGGGGGGFLGVPVNLYDVYDGNDNNGGVGGGVVR